MGCLLNVVLLGFVFFALLMGQHTLYTGIKRLTGNLCQEGFDK